MTGLVQTSNKIIEKHKAKHNRPNVHQVKQSMSEIKAAALGNLLIKVEFTDFYESCKELGWIPNLDNEGNEKPPLQKHIKIAIIDQLMKTAKANGWHLIKDGDFVYIYNAAFWIPLQPDELQNFLKDAAIKMGYPEIESRDSTFINKLYKQSLQDGFFSDRKMEKQSKINLLNGTLEITATGVHLNPFDHRDFMTHQLDFAYDSKATNEIFQKYLDEVLPDKETQQTLQEVAGYLFIKGLKLEKIFFLYGTGANGKSVFFEVLEGVLGDESISNYSLESLTDNTGYYRAKIKDKIVNYGTDIKMSRIDPGLFKTLASGEPIEARLPYGQPFVMKDYAKLIFNVNKLDNANIEHTHGFHRKLLIIPFNRTLKEDEQDHDLHKKILQNKAGVLNWIIEGSERVIKNRNISISQECRQFIEQFIKETDTAALFIEEKNIIRSEQEKIHMQDLYIDYQKFCKDNRYNLLTYQALSKQLESLGYKKAKDRKGIFFEMAKK